MKSTPVFRGPSQTNPHSRKEKAMRKRFYLFMLESILLPVGIAGAARRRDPTGVTWSNRLVADGTRC